MKQIIVVTCVVVLAFFTTGCERSKTVRAQQDESQSTANRVVRNIQYIKDPRTGLCFAYYYGGSAGGSGLTTVPCEAIPPELLTVAK